MNIYFLRRPSVSLESFGSTYTDTYDGLVVAAKSIEDALTINPDSCGNDNWYHNETPVVELIGLAASCIKRGIIMYSWSSTG